MWVVLCLWSCTSQYSREAEMWKLDLFWRDNWRFLQRDPELLKRKFQKMEESHYNFMRGSFSLYLAERALRSEQRIETMFLNDSNALMLPIFGDAHPENLTVCAEVGQEESIEFVDLDASVYGAWIIDVNRAALSLRILLDDIDSCLEECQTQAVSEVVQGYLAGIFEEESRRSSSILEGLFLEALEEGAERRKYNKYTEGDILRFFYDSESGKGIAELTLEEEELAIDIFREFGHDKANIRLLDVGRRLGMGVSSLPALRFVFLWDQGQEGEEDNRLTLAREILDPPSYFTHMDELAVFTSNSERIEFLANELWVNPRANSDYGGIQLDSIEVKFQRWSSFFQDLEKAKIEEAFLEEEVDLDDIFDLSYNIGQILGERHGKSKSFFGENSRLIIQKDITLGGGKKILEDEIVEHSIQDYQSSLNNYQWFQALIETEGFLLGMEKVQ